VITVSNRLQETVAGGRKERENPGAGTDANASAARFRRLFTGSVTSRPLGDRTIVRSPGT